jgi:hypothetical protein
LTSNTVSQLRHSVSIQSEGTRLLEKHAIAPSAARLCCVAAWKELLTFRNIIHTNLNSTIDTSCSFVLLFLQQVRGTDGKYHPHW